MENETTLQAEILELCDANPEGITQEDISKSIKAELKQIQDTLNILLKNVCRNFYSYLEAFKRVSGRRFTTVSLRF